MTANAAIRVTPDQLRSVAGLASALPFPWTLQTVYDDTLGEEVLVAIAKTRPRASQYVIGRDGKIGIYSRAARELLGLPPIERRP